MMPENSPQYVCSMSQAKPKGSKGYLVDMTWGEYSQVAQISRGITSMLDVCAYNSPYENLHHTRPT